VNLIDRLSTIRFAAGDHFEWLPSLKTVVVSENRLTTDEGKLCALHEISHALLGHESSDTPLARKRAEESAWDLARELAKRFEIAVDEQIW
jgi:hypothetical protein